MIIIEEYKDFNWLIFDEITSTNTVAKAFVKDNTPIKCGGKAVSELDTPFCLFSYKQTAGRGRYGKNFYSEVKDGLYITFVVEADIIESRYWQMVPLMSAVALIECFKEFGLDNIFVKWVNDIFKGDKKIGGILTELTHSLDGKKPYLIVGTGINLAGDSKELEALSEGVGGFVFEKGLPDGITILDVARKYAYKWLELFYNFDSEKILSIYKSKMLGLGKVVTFEYNEKEQTGKLLDLDEVGHLIIELPDGEKMTVTSASIHFSSKRLIKEIKHGVS